jgi:hypothetical protein
MKILKMFRAVLILYMIAIFAQFAFAGLSLTGNSSAVSLHRSTGILLMFLTAAQAMFAVAMRAQKICPAWVVLSNCGIAVAALIQAFSGHYAVLQIHVPLALAIFGGVFRQMYWATREAAAAFAAAGGVGIEIVRQATKRHHDVTAFARSTEPLQPFTGKITIVQGDLLNPSSLEGAVTTPSFRLLVFGSHGQRAIRISAGVLRVR